MPRLEPPENSGNQVPYPKGSSFAELLTWHLNFGTRPTGSPDRPGNRWRNEEFAFAVLARTANAESASRVVRNWRAGRNQPLHFDSVERALFGDNDDYTQWRVDLRRAYDGPQQTVKGNTHSEVAVALAKIRSILDGDGTIGEPMSIAEIHRLFGRLMPRPPDWEALRNDYLQWTIRENQILNSYGFPRDERRSDIRLKEVFVTLRAVDLYPYDRFGLASEIDELKGLDKDGTLSSIEPQAMEAARLAMSGPTSIEYEERDRPSLYASQAAEPIGLDSAFCSAHRLVIQGGPGSGKTTLLRWLALALAEVMLAPPKSGRVEVARSDLDMDMVDTTETRDLGPVRLPVLINVADYARKRREQGGTLKIIDYLGHHMSNSRLGPILDNRGNPIEFAKIHDIIVDAIIRNEAVILIDGLDETAGEDERWAVKDQIENFSAFAFRFQQQVSQDFSSVLPTAHGPGQIGGNQIVVTSRIAGYISAGLSAEFRHFTIESMGENAIRRYAEKYFREHYRISLNPNQWNTAAVRAADARKDDFIREITGPRNKAVRELAATPVLLCILIMVFMKGRGRLPHHRVHLYSEAISIVVEGWRERTKRIGENRHDNKETPLELPEIYEFSEIIAAHLQEHSGSGTIDRDSVLKVLTAAGVDERGDVFLQTVSEDMGLLVEEGSGWIKFPHRTFQEFFAARWLLRYPSDAAKRVRDRLPLPRWREAATMAVSLVTAAPLTARHLRLPLLDPDAFFREIIIPQAVRHSPLLDPAMVIFSETIADADMIPVRAVRDTAVALVSAMSDWEGLQRFPWLRLQIETTWNRLSIDQTKPILQDVLVESLQDAGDKLEPRMLAAAALISVVEVSSSEIGSALIKCIKYDSPDAKWPIDQALRDLAARDPYALNERDMPLRTYLNRNPDKQVAFISDGGLRRLATALYGGYDPSIDGIVIGRFHRDSAAVTPLIIAVLEKELDRQQLLQRLQSMVADTSASEQSRVETLLALIALTEPDGGQVFPVIPGEIHRQVHSSLERLIENYKRIIPQITLRIIKGITRSGVLVDVNYADDFLDDLLGIHLHFDGSTVSISEILPATPSLLKPRVMAEYWQYVLSGLSDDATYSLAVVLDTFGATLARDREALMMSFALASEAQLGAVPNHIGWIQRRPLLVPRTSTQLTAVAIDVCALIPETLRFAAGWVLHCLAELITREGLSEEAIMIAEHLVPLDYGARELALSALNSVSETVRPQESGWRRWRIILRARQLNISVDDQGTRTADNPAYESTYEEFQAATAALRAEHDSRPSLAAAGLPPDDPLELALAAELQLRCFNEPPAARALVPCLRALADSSDFENRCRALMRLSEMVPAEAETLLRCAISQIPSIFPIRRQVSAIRLIVPMITPFADLQREISRISNELPNWERCGVHGQLGQRFLYHEAVLSKCEVDAAPVVAAALFADARNMIIRQTSEQSGESDRTSDLETTIAARHGRVDSETKGPLEALRRSGRIDKFQHFLTRVHTPIPDALPLVRSWASASNDPIIHDYANLLIAEATGLTSDNIDSVVNLLRSADAKSRARAAMVMYGRGNSPRAALSLTRIGDAALNCMTDLLSEAKTSGEASVAQAISWAFETIRHDNPTALRRWIREAEADGTPQAARAVRILSRIEHLDPKLWPFVLEMLRNGPDAVARALVRSVCVMAARNRVPLDFWPKFAGILNSRDRAAFGDHRLVTDPNAFLAPSANLSTDRFVGTVSKLLFDVGPMDADRLRQSCSIAGEFTLYGDTWRMRIARAAKLIEPKSIVYRTMITRLIAFLRKPPQTDWFLFPADDIICLTAAAVEYRPGLFIDLVGDRATGHPTAEQVTLRSDLERILTVTAQTHHAFTGRMAAQLLLSFLRHISMAVAQALRAGIRDVPNVRSQTLAGVDRYLSVDEDALHHLLVDLKFPSDPVDAYLSGRLLTALARNPSLQSHVEGLIIPAFQAAIETAYGMDVFLVSEREGAGSAYAMEHIGRLDGLLIALLADITGNRQ